MPSSEAGAQHSKNNAGYDDVEVVTLPRKGQSGQCHTRHGCSCEQQEPELDDAATAQRQDIRHDPGYTAQVGSLSMEYPISGHGRTADPVASSSCHPTAAHEPGHPEQPRDPVSRSV